MSKWMIFCNTLVLLMLPLQVLHAEKVSIPIVLDYPVLQQIILNTAFKQPDNSLKYSYAPGHCNTVIFSSPKLKSEARQLLIRAKTDIRLGFAHDDGCTTLAHWQGESELISLPVLKPEHPLQIFFIAPQIRLFDTQGQAINNQLLNNALNAQIEPIIKMFKIDLQAAKQQTENVLEALLPHHSEKSMRSLVDSLRLARVNVLEEGLAVNLTVELQKPKVVKQTEAVLSNNELQAFNVQWQQWDAFFTFVIKQLAKQTQSAELQDALLDILLDIRYQIQAILKWQPGSTQDPVKTLFTRSWQQLQPLVHQISQEAGGTAILPVFSFMTATNALQTLEKLGPEFGLEISTDGLRRLARLLNRQNKQPLQYLDTEDPVLIDLFQLHAPKKVENISWNLSPVASAHAETNGVRLNHWVPEKSELPEYLADIRSLILQQVDKKGQTLNPEYQKVYRQLLLTTAWQESCWRQYVVKDRKIVPLSSSTGDVGLFQINERVWRGIYAKQKLRWDIAYNTHAGGDILFRYLTRYAIKQQEHKQPGGLDNLARSAYSTYNGGPSRVARYRKTKGIPLFHRQIDRFFWEKYQQVKLGKEYAVALCLGGNEQTIDLSKSTAIVNKKEKVPVPPTITPVKIPLNPPTITSVKIPLNPPIITLAKTPVKTAIVKPAKTSLPKQNFTLQLAALSNKKAAQKLRQTFKISGYYQYYAIKKDGQVLYLLTYGNFPTKSAANKAATKFTTVKPWVRSYKSIRNAAFR